MNIQSVMAQAQKMQKEILKKQEEIYNTTFEGKSEWVTVTMDGKRNIKKVDITYAGNIDEDRDMLGDMITIAINDANKKINKEIESKLGAYSNMLSGLM